MAADEAVFKLEELLKEEHLHEVPSWWAALPIVGRARGRWVFVEPNGLEYPRQRARREMQPFGRLDDLDLPETVQVERHNKSQHFKPLKGPNLEAWKSFCLQTTNQAYQKVPEPDPYFGPGVWMRMFRKSHAGLLRAGALEKVEVWYKTSTQRQRAALSELLWSFNDHLTMRRGRTSTKIAFGPKSGEQAHINLIDPFASSLGRPSSAPIAHAVQRNFEARKRESEAKNAEIGRAVTAARRTRDKGQPFEKREVDTLKSTIPLKWAGKGDGKMISSNQLQMQTVKPADLALAIKWAVPTIACNPPATSGMGRHLGKEKWHGDSMYGDLWPAARKTFQDLDEMRRPHLDIPGMDRLKGFVL